MSLMVGQCCSLCKRYYECVETMVLDLIFEALVINWLKRESNKYEEDTRIDFTA
jgi:hypothetical protein